MKKILFSTIFVIALLVNLYYGYQKAGYHEDEYYTYYSSNRSIGLFQPDRQWQDRQAVLDEFAVKEGEGFNYKMVKLVQSWDVHPPVYYFIFHTFCSFIPGIFSKWPGLITNLIAFAIAYILLILLMEELNVPLAVEVITLIFWSLNPQTVSCNMLIRMYAWLGAAILGCAYCHVRLVKYYDNNSLELKDFILKSLVPVMAVSYLGFLIQYFYIFFFVTIGIAVTAWIVFVKKDVKYGVTYVIGCAVSLGVAVVTYPSSLSHMFGGYRGTGASGSLFDLANTGMRISFFFGLLNDFVFGKGLVLIVFMIMLGIMVKLTSKSLKKKEQKPPRPEVIILTIGTIGYFLLTSKTALLVGSASNRYEMPIYSLIILLVFMDGYYVLSSVGNVVLVYAFFAVIMALLLKGHVYDRSVLFLYLEDTEKIAYASENKDQVAVVMFNPKTPQNVWRLTDELLEYPKVFYMDEENLDKLTDSEVTSAKKLILYAADDEVQKEALQNLLDSCSLSTLDYVSSEDMWCTYEVR